MEANQENAALAPAADATAPAAPVFDAGAALAALKSMPPANVVSKEMTFRFRKDSTTGSKRPNLVLQVPVYTEAGLYDALATPKYKEFVLKLLASTAEDAARAQINDGAATFSQRDLDLAAFTMEAFSSVAESERKSAAIPKEQWEAFAADYIETMHRVLPNTPPDKIQNAASLLVKRFSTVKTAKPVITKLVEYLNMWLQGSGRAEDFVDIYESLVSKSNELLNLDPKAWADMI